MCALSAVAPVVAQAEVSLTVTTTAASGPGSLHDALASANANPGADIIDFAFDGSEPVLLEPSTGLPAITEAVTLRGELDPSGSPRITLRGVSLVLAYGSSTITGLRFDGAPIVIATSSNTIEGNHFTAAPGLVGTVIPEAPITAAGRYNTIRGNRAEGPLVALERASFTTIHQNTVTGITKHGVLGTEDSHSTITNNELSGGEGATAIVLANSSDSIVRGNTIEAGVAVRAVGVEGLEATDNRVTTTKAATFHIVSGPEPLGAADARIEGNHVSLAGATVQAPADPTRPVSIVDASSVLGAPAPVVVEAANIVSGPAAAPPVDEAPPVPPVSAPAEPEPEPEPAPAPEPAPEPDETGSAGQTAETPLPAVSPSTEVPTGTSAADSVATDPSRTSAVPTTATAGLLDQGLTQVETSLASWAALFDLNGLDLATRTPALPAFQMPVAPQQLGAYFGVPAAVAGTNLPSTSDLSGTALGPVVTRLEAAGCTINFASGINGKAPPTDSDIIQAACPLPSRSITKAVGFTGDGFNDATPNALQDAASAKNINGTASWTGSLAGSFVVGVDTTGAYLLGSTNLRLTVGGTTTLSGSLDQLGLTGLTATGSATASLTVGLNLAANPTTKVLLSTFATTPASKMLVPSISGSASATIGVVSSQITTSWTGVWAVTTASGSVAVKNTAQTFVADARIPGLTSGANPVIIHLDGSRATQAGVPGWVLHGTGSAVADPKLAGVSLENLTVDAFASASSLAGTGHATLLVNSGAPTRIPLGIDFAFSPHAITVHGQSVLEKQIIGAAPSTLYVDGATLVADFNLNLDNGTATGGVQVDGRNAGIGVLLPQGALPPPPGVVPPGAGTLTNFLGLIDSAGNLILHADTATADLGNGDLLIDLTGIDVAFGPAASGPLVSVASATGRIPSLSNLVVNVTGLSLSRSTQKWSAGAASASVSGFTGTMSIAGILSFTLTSVTVSFPSLSDISTFTANVTGSFDFSGFDGLPFTPVLNVGGTLVTPTSPPAQNTFSFSVAIDGGSVAPLSIPPITLGFADLAVGGVTFGGTITLGGVTNGVVNPVIGGSMTIGAGIGIVSGSVTASVLGTFGASALDLDVTFAVSGSIGLTPPITFTGADLKLHLRIDRSGIDLTMDPQFDGLGIDSFSVPFGPNVAFTAANVTMDFTPPAGQPMIAFGAGGGLNLAFANLPSLAGWGGTAQGFAIGPDLVPCALDGFGASVTFPANFNAALPSWLPLSITGVGFSLNASAGTGSVDGCHPFANLSDVKINVSGGLNAATLPGEELFPFDATVDKLELDLAKLAAGEFPISGLDGFSFGVAPFDIAGVKVGGGLSIGTLDVNGTTVFYLRIGGTIEVGGIGGGADLVVTQYGPVLLAVEAPLGIPLGPSGAVLAGARGELRFGPPTLPEPDPADPLALLTLPIFQELGDPSITPAKIQAAVTPAVLAGVPTWATGGTLSISGTFIHVAAPGIVKGAATIAANVAPGTGVNLFGKGQIDVLGMPFGVVGFRADLSDPIAPKFNFAASVPAPGSPLGLVIPAQANFGAVLDTKGLVAGTIAGVGAFCNRLANGTLEVGGQLFDDAIGAVATSLEKDRKDRLIDGAYRPLTRAALDVNGNGLVEPVEQKTITKALLKARLAAVLPGTIPTDPLVIQKLAVIAQAVITELTTAGGAILNGANPGSTFGAGTEQLVAAGSKAAAAFVTVINDSIRDGLDAFLAVADPKLTIVGSAQPVILGIPLGQPTAQVGITVSKDRIGVQLFANLTDIMALSSPGGPFLAAVTPLQSTVSVNAELPVAGALAALVGGSSYPTSDPNSAWGVTIEGGIQIFHMPVGAVSGMLVPRNNPSFVDAHVQKLFNNEVFNPIDIARPIPITTQAQYNNLVANGGLVITGKLSAPELLTDPIGLAKRTNLTPPTDPLQIPAWLSAIGTAAGTFVSPGFLQVYLPPAGSPGALLVGQWDAKLLSLPISKGTILGTAQGLTINGELPLAGLRGDITIQASNGGSTLPKASASIALDTSKVNAALADLGLPSSMRLPPAASQANAKLLAFTPGFDPAAKNPDGSPDLLKRRGGVQFDANIVVPGFVSNARAAFSVSPGSGTDAFLPDFSAVADVTNLTPHPDVRITSARLAIKSIAGATAINVNGSGTVFGVTATVKGVLNPDGTGSLTLTASGGVPLAPGFTLTSSFSLVLSKTGATVTFNGQLTLPPWLSSRAGKSSVAVNGTASTDGSFDLSISVTDLPLDATGKIRLSSGTDGIPLLRFRRAVGGVASLTIHGKVTLQSGGIPLLAVDGSLDSTGKGNLAISFTTAGLDLGGFRVMGGATIDFDPNVTPLKLDITVNGSITIPGVVTSATVTGKMDGNGIAFLNVTAAGADASRLGMTGVTLTSLTLTLTRTGIAPTFGYSLTAVAVGNVVGVVNGATLNGTVTSAGNIDVSIGVNQLNLIGGATLNNAVFRLKRTATATTVEGTGTFAFLSASLNVNGFLTVSSTGVTGSLTLALPGAVAIGPFALGGSLSLTVLPTASSVSVTNGTVKLPGWDRAVGLSGSLSTTGLGTINVVIGTTPLRFTGTPFSVGGTFSLTRTATSTTTTTTTATATNATFTWDGVGSITVTTFLIRSDGAATVVVPARSFALPLGGTFDFGGGSFVTDPNALAARLVVSPSRLAIPGVATGNDRFVIPGFTIAVGDFSITLTDGDFDLGVLKASGRFLFEKTGSVFRVRATNTTAGLPVRLAIGTFATIDLTTFNVATDGTFDVQVVGRQLGPVQLSIRDASVRFTRTATATSVTIDGGKLFLPAVGDPITLPSFTISTAASFDQTFTFGVNLGPLFNISSAQYRFKLSNGVLSLDLVDIPNSTANQPTVTALAGSANMVVRAFHVDSAGGFEGEIRGRVGVFGRQLATATMKVTRIGTKLRITVDPPATVDLGFAELSVGGFYDTSGAFSLTGSFTATAGICDALCLSGTVSMTVSSGSGISGSFSGRVCVGLCGTASGSVSSTGRVTGRVTLAGVGVDYAINLGSSSSGDTDRPDFDDDPLPRLTVRADAINGSARVLYNLPRATDGSARPAVVCSPVPGTDFAVGETTVTCTATDAANNERVRTFVLELIDNNATSFTLAAGTQQAVAVAGADAVGTAVASMRSDPRWLGNYDVNDDGTIKATVTVPTDMPLGEHTLTLYAKDENGDDMLWQWRVTVVPPPLVPAAIPPATATGTGAPSGATSSATTGSLPQTGTPFVSTAGTGVALILAGAGCSVAGRRRRRNVRSSPHASPGRG